MSDPPPLPNYEVNEEKAAVPYQAAKRGGRSRHDPAAWSGPGRSPAAALTGKGYRGNTMQGKGILRGVLERGQVNEKGGNR